MPRLADIVGQTTAVKVLQRALKVEKLHGTWLFVGTPGVGRGALAQAFAQAAACLSPHTDPFDACGVCTSCRYAQSGSHPEILFIRPAGQQMQIWQFWDRQGRPPGALSHSLAFAPTIGRKRVYVLEEADRLNEAAANSLLKVLEEPPDYALFILTAPHPARVLPTIVSRCQLLRLHPMLQTELATLLQQRFGLEPTAAYQIAGISEGRVGQAMRLASSPHALREIEQVFELMEMIAVAPRGRALRLGEQVRHIAAGIKALQDEETQTTGEGEIETPREQAARRQLGALYDLMVVFYRDLYLLASCGTEATIVNVHRRAELARVAQKRSPDHWQRAISIVMLSRRRLDYNANIQLLTDTLLMQLLAL